MMLLSVHTSTADIQFTGEYLVMYKTFIIVLSVRLEKRHDFMKRAHREKLLQFRTALS